MGVEDVTLTGSASVTTTGCSVRSNAGINLTGTSNITATGTYAAGSISTGTSGVINGGTYPNSGALSDPYAGNAALTTAFSTLATNTVNIADPNPQLSNRSRSYSGTYPSITLGGSATVTN